MSKSTRAAADSAHCCRCEIYCSERNRSNHSMVAYQRPSPRHHLATTLLLQQLQRQYLFAFYRLYSPFIEWRTVVSGGRLRKRRRREKLERKRQCWRQPLSFILFLSTVASRSCSPMPRRGWSETEAMESTVGRLGAAELG